jgi:hypothetical protein
MTVTGAQTFTGNTTMSNDATIGGALTVTGAQTFTGNTTMSNDATIGGALNVTGDTTILGSLNIKDPTEDGHAASRRYVDKLASISAVLDTRMPAPGKNNRVTLNIAGIHNQSAIGLSIVGLFEDDAERAWDYSLGVAASSGDTMTKADIGFSW